MFVLFEKKYYFCITKLATGGAARRQAFPKAERHGDDPKEPKKHETFSNPSVRYFPLSQGWNTSILRVGQQQDAGWDKVN